MVGRMENMRKRKKEQVTKNNNQEEDQSTHASSTTQSDQNVEPTISSEIIQEEEIEDHNERPDSISSGEIAEISHESSLSSSEDSDVSNEDSEDIGYVEPTYNKRFLHF